MSLAAPKSTRSASAADETPSASGVAVSQPAVGHGVAALSAASALPTATSSALAPAQRRDEAHRYRLRTGLARVPRLRSRPTTPVGR